MTDERMSPDVRLREGEREELLDAVPSWPTLVTVVERIVAARVGEVVERVEALHRGTHMCLGGIWWTNDPLYRGTVAYRGDCSTLAALRAAQAPPSAEGVASGHGGAGGDLRAGEGE